MAFTHFPLGSVVRGKVDRPFVLTGYGDATPEGGEYVGAPTPAGTWAEDGKPGSSVSSYRLHQRDFREVLFLGMADSTWAAFESCLPPLHGPQVAAEVRTPGPLPVDPLEAFLPVGSVVDVRVSGEADLRVLVAGHGFSRRGVLHDYFGYRWPAGARVLPDGHVDPATEAYFDAIQIDRVLFRGYEDEMTRKWLRSFPSYMDANGMQLPFVRDCRLRAKPFTWWWSRWTG